jgi:hypothetical protein
VARVDVGDDGIRRFVVRHYRYDLKRNERRHVIVDAFDNEAEFLALLESIQADIQRRSAAGEPVGRNEHASGTVYEPGHDRRAATGHLVRRMVEHGVAPDPGSTRRTCLPTSRPSASIGNAGSRPGPVGRARRLIRRWLRGAGRP